MSPFSRTKNAKDSNDKSQGVTKNQKGSMIKPIGIPEVENSSIQKASSATSAQGATSFLDMSASMGQLKMSPQSPPKKSIGRNSGPSVHWSNKILRGGIEDCGAPPRVARDLSESVQGRKYEQMLKAANVDSNVLQKMAWNGIPEVARAVVWQLLLGYG